MARIIYREGVTPLNGRVGATNFGTSAGGYTARAVAGNLSNGSISMLLRDAMITRLAKAWAAGYSYVVGFPGKIATLIREGWDILFGRRRFVLENFRREGRGRRRRQSLVSERQAGMFLAFMALAGSAIHAGWPNAYNGDGTGYPAIPMTPPGPAAERQLDDFRVRLVTIGGQKRLLVFWRGPWGAGLIQPGNALVVLGSRVLTKPTSTRTAAMRQITTLIYSAAYPADITDAYVDAHGDLYGSPPQGIRFRGSFFNHDTLTYGNTREWTVNF